MSWFGGLFGGADSSTTSRVKEVVAAGATVIDVRTDDEFNGGHVPGAKNIPVHTLPLRLNEVGPKDRPVVLYCRSGARSAQAAQILRRAGWTDVIDVGPMSAFPR